LDDPNFQLFGSTFIVIGSTLQLTILKNGFLGLDVG